MNRRKNIALSLNAEHTGHSRQMVQARSAVPKVAGTLRRAVRSQAFAKILGGRHMECAYY